MWNWISKLEEFRAQGMPVVVVTVAQCMGSTPRETGAKMLVLKDGRFFGTIGGGHLEELALQDAAKCFENSKSQVLKYPLGAKTGQCCGGSVELLFEVVNVGPRIYVFGAGHVGQAVCKTFSGTPFAVHLVDERKEWVESPQLPQDTIRHCCEWDDFVEEAEWDSERTYVAVMTHRHDLDQEIISALIRRPTKYIGLIGSQAKWARFKQRLSLKGCSDAELARVTCPMGIKTGGKSPQEVAISLAAEALQIHYQQNRI